MARVGPAPAGPGRPVMADRKPFLLRIDRDVLDALQRWADDDLRSLNGQIEFVLRNALRKAGRTAEATKDGRDAKDGRDLKDR